MLTATPGSRTRLDPPGRLYTGSKIGRSSAIFLGKANLDHLGNPPDTILGHRTGLLRGKEKKQHSQTDLSATHGVINVVSSKLLIKFMAAANCYHVLSPILSY